MQRILRTLAAIALLVVAGGLLSGTATAADAAKPVAIVSLTSYDELRSDVSLVGKLIDRPEIGNAMEGIVAMVTQGKGLAGIDKSRPMGVLVQTDGQGFEGYAFLPVTDLKQVLEVVGFFAKVDDLGAGVHKISPKDGKKSSFVKAQGGWAYLSDKQASLADVAADPLALLKGLEKKYVFAGRVFAANIPAQFRESFLAKVREGADRDMRARKPGQSEEDYQLAKKVAQTAIQAIEGAVNDLDQVALGWGIDRSAETTFLDLSIKAKDGSPTASQMALLQNATSKFGGFRLPGAALAGNWSATMSAAKIEALDALIPSFHEAMQHAAKREKSPEKLAIAKEVIDKLTELAQKTVKSGRFDAAVTVLLDPKAVTGLLGAYVADGNLLDKTLRSVAAAAIQENPGVADLIKLDADRAKSVRLHTVSIPIGFDAKNRDKLIQVFGDNIEFVVGTGPQSVYLAAGRDAMATLKRAIDASEAAESRTVPPVDISLATEPVARLMAAVGEPKQKVPASRMAEELKKSSGQDHINLVAHPIPHGIQYHLEVESGIVRLVGHYVAVTSAVHHE